MLLQDYGDVLKYCYEHALNWAYEQADNPLPKEDIEKVFADNKTINIESFLGNLYLWSYISKNMPFANPTIGMHHSICLSPVECHQKGGSDTFTKLL
jgi:hypothetical protein